jgi:hypothetical protein
MLPVSIVRVNLSANINVIPVLALSLALRNDTCPL